MNKYNHKNNNNITKRVSLKADAKLFPAIFVAHVLSVCTGWIFKTRISLRFAIKWSASSRWSISPNSAWSGIETRQPSARRAPLYFYKNYYCDFDETNLYLGRLKALPKCGHVHFSRLQQSLAEMLMNSLLPPCPKWINLVKNHVL